MQTSNAAGIGESPSLADLLGRSAKRSPYFAKDLAKVRQATQFIGQGSPNSSTAAYARAAAPRRAPTPGATPPATSSSSPPRATGLAGSIPSGKPRMVPIGTIDGAIAARARFAIDRPADRHRPHNIGERQVAAYLEAHGYEEAAPGHFVPARS